MLIEVEKCAESTLRKKGDTAFGLCCTCECGFPSQPELQQRSMSERYKLWPGPRALQSYRKGQSASHGLLVGGSARNLVR